MMRKGFTLIELLIVVAIIAILAAIAVPNFLEAQTRAKVARAKNDLRTYATGLESYIVDQNKYPPDHSFGTPGIPPASPPVPPEGILERLSTPIAYLSNAILPSAFNAKQRLSSANAASLVTATPVDNPDHPVYRSYLYYAMALDNRVSWSGNEAGDTFDGVFPLNATAWLMQAPGPQQIYYNMGGVLDNSSREPSGAARNSASNFGACLGLVYDPTNGTVSFGNIWRGGGNSSGSYAHFMFRAAETQR